MYEEEKFVYFDTQIIKVNYNNNINSAINDLNILSQFQINYYKLNPNHGVESTNTKIKFDNNNNKQLKYWINIGSISILKLLDQFSLDKRTSKFIYWDFKILNQWEDGL